MTRDWIAGTARLGAKASKDVLVVMAKQPSPGAVKTRLGRRLGDDWACRLYTAFLQDMADRFEGRRWQLVWAVHPPGSDLASIVGRSSPVLDQEGDDLGDRMRRCFETLFERGAERVVMIGADAPHLPDATMDDAFSALERADVSIVPTRDGGYCLIGMRSAHDVFSGIRMSAASVFAETRARVSALGLELKVAAESFDVDEPEDLRPLAAAIASGEVNLPRTAVILAGRDVREW